MALSNSLTVEVQIMPEAGFKIKEDTLPALNRFVDQRRGASEQLLLCYPPRKTH